MQAFQSEHSTAVSHRQFVPAHLLSSRIQQMQLSLQQMSQRVVFTLMESLLLYTLMFHKITRITYTVQAAQHVPVNQAQS
jgi:hypothetical protein